jgi:hypothetical protein
MFDSNRMYLQEPNISYEDDLTKTLIDTPLTDTNGNEFKAADRKIGSELTIPYHHVVGQGQRVIDYVVEADSSGKLYWRQVRARRWVPVKIEGQNTNICGKWEVERGEPLPKLEERLDPSTIV